MLASGESKKYNIDNRLIEVIRLLYYKVTSVVLLNGSVTDFFQTVAGVREGCPLDAVLLNTFLEKIMQFFDTSASIGGWPLCNLQFVDDIDRLGGSEELQQLTERLEKTVGGYGVEISSNISKLLVKRIKLRSLVNIWMNGKNSGRSGPVQIPRIHTNQRENITKGSEDQNGASTLSHDKTNNAMNKSHQLSYQDQTLQVTCLVNTALWVWELDDDDGSGEANAGLWKWMLQENAWHIIQRAQNQTNMYGKRSTSSPDVWSFYCQPSSVASYRCSTTSVIMIHCRRS